MSSTCKIDGCQKAARKRGWCETHYSRWKRHGDPDVCTAARTLQGRLDKFSEESKGCLVWSGAKYPGGYGVMSIGGADPEVHTGWLGS